MFVPFISFSLAVEIAFCLQMSEEEKKKTSTGVKGGLAHALRSPNLLLKRDATR